MGKASENFEQFSESPDANPVVYFKLLVALASELTNEKKTERANACLSTIVEFYRKHLQVLASQNADQDVWNLISHSTEFDDDNSDLLELVEIAESNRDGDISRLNSHISNAILHREIKRQLTSRRGGGSNAPSFAEKRIWQKVIEIRTRLYGSHDSSLSMPLNQLAIMHEKTGDLDAAEQALEELCQISDIQQRMRWDYQVSLLQFYIRNGKEDKANNLRNTASELKDPSHGLEIQILLAMAKASRQRKDEKTAMSDLQQALQIYRNFPEEVVKEGGNTIIWHCLHEVQTETEFDSYALEIFGVMEKTGFESWQSVDQQLMTIFFRRDQLTRSTQRIDSGLDLGLRKRTEMDVWKALIEIREQERASEPESLVSLFQRLSIAAEGAKEIQESEDSLLRALSLLKGSSETQISSMHLTVSEFYARHGQWEKSEQHWKDGLAVLGGTLNEYSLRGFIHLLETYDRNARNQDAEQLVRALYSHVNNVILETLDPRITVLIDGFINSGNFGKAEEWLELRLCSSLKCVNDLASVEWRIKYSNLLLALERNELSEVLFKQALATMALSNRSTEKVRRQRGTLLQRLGRKDEAEKLESTLAQPEPPRNFILMYGILATQRLQFNHNTIVESYDSTTGERQGLHQKLQSFMQNAGICSLGAMQLGTNLSTQSPIFGQKEKVVNSAHQRHMNLNAIPTDEIDVPPPPEVPGNAIQWKQFRGASRPSDFPAGDYTASQFPDALAHAKLTGLVRFFLTDDTSTSVLTLNGIRGVDNRAPKLQIFYGGNKTLVLNGLAAIVYAPEATVEIPFNGSFCGAIVAGTITAKGNNNLSLDVSLLNKELF